LIPKTGDEIRPFYKEIVSKLPIVANILEQTAASTLTQERR
jgi:hypothetical protein